MKYPQLVSTRAVNAISDWLVSRLEQLGVEAPHIYSRLLLSLLQSSVQINDPIEFSNLETFFANRKGNNKRYHQPCDKDTLKKIAAVQCLVEIVSSEQEITKIENLVNELCEKLNDIEKQSTNEEGDENQLHIALSVASAASSSGKNLKGNSGGNNNNHSKVTATGGSSSGIATRTTRLNLNSTSSSSTSPSSAAELEDPRKRYYRAFPALSKDMEDSFRVLKRNTKSLTWPFDRNVAVSTSIAGTLIGESSSSSAVAVSSILNKASNTFVSAERPVKETEKAKLQIASEIAVNNATNTNNSTNTAGVKRKTKRRRNQALSKGKSGNTLRKNSFGGRNSPTCWDTDFEGCWEMGRDLIKEFIVKQNSRNRSTSESAAYNMRQVQQQHEETQQQLCTVGGDEHDTNFEKRMKPMMSREEAIPVQHTVQYQQQSQLKSISPEDCTVDISFCKDIIAPSPLAGDDTLASVSEITDGSMSTARRLYERDVSNDTINSDLDQVDFAQFKAKFNSSVEALWNNDNNNDNATTTIGSLTTNENKAKNNATQLTSSSLSSIAKISTLPAVSPFKENLKNFWANYYNHHYDLSKFYQPCMDESSVLQNNGELSCDGRIGEKTTSDYYSMSSNFSGFDKSVGGCSKKVGKSTPIGVFLQNSIWSENSNPNYPDTDESFAFKVWNSSQKLQNDLKLKMNASIAAIGDSRYYFPCNISKWSEGINGGPNSTSSFDKTCQNQLQPSFSQSHQELTLGTSSSTTSTSAIDYLARCVGYDTIDSTTSSAAPKSSYLGNLNWQTSVGHNYQADVQSWNSSNPMSLPEMYGGNNLASAKSNVSSVTIGGNKNANHDGSHLSAASLSTLKSPSSGSLSSCGTSSSSSSFIANITLSNHSAASGFVEYSRIKSVVKMNDSVMSTRKGCINLQPKSEETKNFYRKTAAASSSSSSSSCYQEDENLLTSERTHFHPIKSYADGHSFDISSSLDIIDYKRSHSGYFYFESEKYLEYTRSDAFLSEEENGSSISANSSLYSMSSNCGASNLAITPAAANAPPGCSDFVIKFRIKNCEIACQTDPDSFAAAETPCNSAVHERKNNTINSNDAKVVLANPFTCNNTIDALNKAVAVAASAAAATLKSERHSNECMETTTSSTSNYQMRCCIQDGAEDSSVSIEQWSMVEIGKKCIDNNSSHTLWGMCPACNNDMKSIPANRLLKDELNVEADEIMSDLKYMQDLYIESDWEDDELDDEDDDDDDPDDCGVRYDENDTDLDAETIRDCEFYQSVSSPDGCCGSSTKDEINAVDQQQQILYNVNKLIADLLKPENVKTLANALADVSFNGGAGTGTGIENVGAETKIDSASTTASPFPTSEEAVPDFCCGGDGGCGVAEETEEENVNEKYVGGLWNCEENIIWKKEFKPIDIISRLNRNNNINDSFLETLNWEYSNLAEIWNKTTTPSKSPKNCCNPVVNQKQTNTADDHNIETSTDDEKDEESHNFKNLVSFSRNMLETPINECGYNSSKNTNVSTTMIDQTDRRLIDCKRVHNFLNATTKFKIANRFDRKRRHSASQNVCCNNNNNISSFINNNNNNTNNNNNNNNNNSCIKNNNNNNIINVKLNVCGDDFPTAIGYNDETTSLSSYSSSSSSPKIDGDNTTTLANTLIKNSLFEFVKKSKEASRFEKQQGTRVFNYKDNDKGDYHHHHNDENACDSSKTIITCKYWTTINPMSPEQNEDHPGTQATTASFFIDKNSVPSIALNTSSILKHVTLVSRPLTR